MDKYHPVCLHIPVNVSSMILAFIQNAVCTSTKNYVTVLKIFREFNYANIGLCEIYLMAQSMVYLVTMTQNALQLLDIN